MKTTTHKSVLKKATLFAAIGTTLYTLFVPIPETRSRVLKNKKTLCRVTISYLNYI